VPNLTQALTRAESPTGFRDQLRFVVWAAFILATALYLLAVVLSVGSLRTTSGSTGWISEFLIPVATYAFPVAGVLITLRRPRNVIGWLCLASGLCWGALLAIETYIPAADPSRAGALPGFVIALVLESVVWIPTVGIMFFLVMVFPDGRLPSPRWRALARVTALTLLALAIGSLLGTENFANSGHPEVANPLAATPIAPIMALVAIAAALALPAWLLAAAVSVGVRYRRATGIERLQLKWLVAAGAAVGIAYATAMALGAARALAGTNWGGPISLAADVAFDLAVASFALPPIAIGFATLRYRLYDIDVIVNRTLVYGGATVILAAAFGVANIGSQRALESLTGERSELLTAGLAVIAALGFAPTRRWIRPIVDRVLPARARLALLFTDIVGSTRIAAEIGDRRWRDLLERYRAAVRRELNRFGGREIDTAGDGFFATFDGGAEAARCAWAIRNAARELGLETRAGVHVGECEMRGEKVSGVAVHTAARVMAAAGDDEILVSDAVSEALPSGEIRLADRGVHELKGVPGEWRLFRLEAVGAPQV
jgi:class 3 adenylate cyclase